MRVRDFTATMDENHPWEENDAAMLEDLAETFTIRRQKLEGTWKKMLTHRQGQYREDDFLNAVYKMMQDRQYVTKLMNKESHVAKRYFIIAKLQRTKYREPPPVQQVGIDEYEKEPSEEGGILEEEEISPPKGQEEMAKRPATDTSGGREEKGDSVETAPKVQKETAKRPAANTSDGREEEEEDSGKPAPYGATIGERPIVEIVRAMVTGQKENDPFKSRIEVAERIAWAG